MTHLGFVRLFSSPLMAFIISAIIVSVFGYLFYRIGNAKRAGAANRYWKLLSLAAEICVAVGLIGLATFAGRMKISADHQILEQRVHISESAAAERIRLAVQHNCTPPGRQALTPYKPDVAKKDLCAIARTLSGANAADADWEMAQMSLREFNSKYPGCIANVFTRHSDCEETVASAEQLADAIQAMEMDKRSSRSDEAMAAMLEAPNAWEFLLLAFFIAAIGVAIKCARAASEYLLAKRSEG